MKHTLESIAALAGVSRGTVSRVINDQPGVKPKVREKVLAIIEETGYVPHPQARSLAGGKTGNIGVIVFGAKPDFLTHHIFYEVLQGIQGQSTISDYDLLLFANRSTSDQAYWKQVATRRKIDGLIIMGEYIQQEYLRYYRDQGIPYVLIGKRDYDSLPLACVTSDYRSGAYLATKHLLDQGRKRIAYIQGLLNTYHENERIAGYKKALLEAGVSFDSSLVVSGHAEQAEAGKQIERLLEQGITFDGLFAANDLMAFGAIEALIAKHYSIPTDISVVGYDDIQAAAYFTPPLTTVRQNKKQLGHEAMLLLLAMLRGELAIDAAKDITLDSELIVRGTS